MPGTTTATVRTRNLRNSSVAAADFYLAPVREVAIVGPDSGSLVRAVRDRFRPYLVLAGGEADEVPLLEGREPVDGRAAAYVCENFACQAPVTTADELVAALAAGPTGPAGSARAPTG